MNNLKHVEINGLGLYAMPYCSESVDCTSPESLMKDMDAAFDVIQRPITPNQYILDTGIAQYSWELYNIITS